MHDGMTVALASRIVPPAPRRAPASLARLVGIGKTYGSGEHAVAALSDATLDIRAGEVTLIEGPSGSGKTTLISILGLLLTPTAGEVWLERPQRRRARRARAARRCARATSASCSRASTCSRR